MKQCELWNVLQNEDEHRLLDSADTKYDALITHVWALNNFAALISNTVDVADLAAWRYTQESKKLTKFRPPRTKCPFTADP